MKDSILLRRGRKDSTQLQRGKKDCTAMMVLSLTRVQHVVVSDTGTLINVTHPFSLMCKTLIEEQQIIFHHETVNKTGLRKYAVQRDREGQGVQHIIPLSDGQGQGVQLIMPLSDGQGQGVQLIIPLSDGQGH